MLHGESLYCVLCTSVHAAEATALSPSSSSSGSPPHRPLAPGRAALVDGRTSSAVPRTGTARSMPPNNRDVRSETRQSRPRTASRGQRAFSNRRDSGFRCSLASASASLVVLPTATRPSFQSLPVAGQRAPGLLLVTLPPARSFSSLAPSPSSSSFSTPQDAPRPRSRDPGGRRVARPRLLPPALRPAARRRAR